MTMKRLLLISGIIALSIAMAEAQTMIGLPKEEVAELVRADHADFRKDASVIKQRFNYLKYVNGLRTKTWILYFNDGDTCQVSKLVCDYTELDDVLKDINGRCSQVNDSTWTYQDGPDTLQVELIRQEWYFTIRETRKE
jgi:hypothetical protein